MHRGHNSLELLEHNSSIIVIEDSDLYGSQKLRLTVVHVEECKRSACVARDC